MPGYLPKPPFPRLNKALSISQGLIMSLPFGEKGGSTAYDYSGNNNHGTIVSDVQPINTPFGGGYIFAGNNDYIYRTSDSLNFGTGDFTISAWVKSASGSSIDIVSKRGSTSNQGFMFSQDTSEVLYFEIEDGANNEVEVFGTVDIFDGKWHHVLCKREGDNIYVYTDAADEQSADASAVGSISNGISLLIGLNGSAARDFKGIIDHVHIWKRALSFNEISFLYHDSFPMYRFPLPAFFYKPNFSADGLEVLYPIQPVTRTNKIVYSQDSKTWDSVQKSASEWHHELWTGRFRIQEAYMDAMYTFILAHAGSPITLNIPGIQPFIRTSESNSVYIVPGSFKADREPDRPMHYVFSLTFMREP